MCLQQKPCGLVTEQSSLTEKHSRACFLKSGKKRLFASYPKIYGRAGKQPVTQWQQAVNEAAASVALINPVLLSNRSELKIKAENIARQTFHFSKGKSRSKSTEESSSSVHILVNASIDFCCTGSDCASVSFRVDV